MSDDRANEIIRRFLLDRPEEAKKIVDAIQEETEALGTRMQIEHEMITCITCNKVSDCATFKDKQFGISFALKVCEECA